MYKIRRMPTEYEKKAIRFNRNIEIIQSVCRVLGFIGFIVGGFCMIETEGIELSISEAIAEWCKAVSIMGVSVLLWFM